MMKPVKTRSVACGSCRLCCINDAIFLHPECGDDIHLYATEIMTNPLTRMPQRKIVQKRNGECFYLGPKGCTIYDQRPAICREYDCGDQHASMSKATRRMMIARGYLSKDKCEAGRRQWIKRQKDTRKSVDPRDPDPSRFGIFRDHNCAMCGSGARPCVQGNPNRCEFPHARND